MPAEDEAEIPRSGAVFSFGLSRFADNVPSHFFIRNDPVVDLDCGDEHTLIVCQSGRVFSFGKNDWGQLGVGNRCAVAKPSCVKSLKPTKIKHVSCGRTHSLILSENNQVYSCGNNSDGQLGLGNAQEVLTPQLIESLSDVVQLSAGSHHSAALKSDGSVYVWGTNNDGQLGLGPEVKSSDVPVKLNFDQKFVQVSCGYYHTLLLTEDGKVCAFGEAENGKLGLGDTKSVYVPTVLSIDSRVNYISAGGNHSAVISDGGVLLVWGSNGNGELGLQDESGKYSTPVGGPSFPGSKVQYVSCGYSHTAIVTECGMLYMCGEARHGKLGFTPTMGQYQKTPTPIGKFSQMKVSKVSCGGCHTIVWALPRRKSLTENTINDVFTSTLIENNSQSLTRAVLPPIQKAPSTDSPKTTSTENPPTSESQSNKSMEGVTIGPGLNEEKLSDQGPFGDVEQLAEGIRDITTQSTNHSSQQPAVSVSNNENAIRGSDSNSQSPLSTPKLLTTLHNMYYPPKDINETNDRRTSSVAMIKVGLTSSMQSLSDLNCRLEQCNEILEGAISKEESDLEEFQYENRYVLPNNSKYYSTEYNNSGTYLLQKLHNDHLKAFERLETYSSNLPSCKCKGDHRCVDEHTPNKYDCFGSEQRGYVRNLKKISPLEHQRKEFPHTTYSCHDRPQCVYWCNHAPRKKNIPKCRFDKKCSESDSRSNGRTETLSSLSDISNEFNDNPQGEEYAIKDGEESSTKQNDHPKEVEENGVDHSKQSGSESKITRFFKKKGRAPQPTPQKSNTQCNVVENEVVAVESAKELHKKSKMCVIL